MQEKIQDVLSGKSVPECLKDFVGRELPCQVTLKFDGLPINVVLISSDLCAAMIEYYTPIGNVDLVTQTEIIEIKTIEGWKEALGQVIAKAQTFPNHSKSIYLFGPSSKSLKKITAHCQVLDVLVTFEKIAVVTGT